MRKGGIQLVVGIGIVLGLVTFYVTIDGSITRKLQVSVILVC